MSIDETTSPGTIIDGESLARAYAVENTPLASDEIPPSLPDVAGPPVDATAAESGKSYSQILRSSSIIGGAQLITVLLGMVRTKGVALFIGPTGIGEVGLLTSSTQLISTLSGLGIGTSGVREVAEANGTGNIEQLSRTITVLRRVCWLTGLIGWVLMASLSGVLSWWSFGDASRAGALTMLGAIVLFAQLQVGQGDILQGTRRIGDLAKQSIIGALLATIVSLLVYGLLGARGIVPVLVIASGVTLAVSWWFARRVPCEPVSITWWETLREGKRLMTLGLAFMYSGLVMTATPWAIQAIVARRFGTAGNGIYTSAWNLSGQFAFFILGAMAADYYPRLAAVATNKQEINRLVNEQSEIGILLALPGLLATMAFAPWVIFVFYSREFLEAATLLPWFVLGVFGRVVSWPMGFVQIAMGRGKMFAITETISAICHVGFVYWLTSLRGIEGAGWAFALLYLVYVGVMLAVSSYLTGFRWSAEVRRLLVHSLIFILASLAFVTWLPEVWGTAAAAFAAGIAGIVSVRGLTKRLGPSHRITLLVSRVPFLVARQI